MSSSAAGGPAATATAGVSGSGASAGAPYVGFGRTRSGVGYWMATQNTGSPYYRQALVDGFGDAAGPQLQPISPAWYVAMAADPGGSGYWLAASDGAVFGSGPLAGGAPPVYGSAAGLSLRAPVVGIASTPSGRGYWLIGRDGGVFAYGDAPFEGAFSPYDCITVALDQPGVCPTSASAQPSQPDVVALAATPSGHGYWLITASGQLDTKGDALFYGTVTQRLNGPVVAMAATPSGHGYWIVAADGGVFAFGDATFYGSMGGRRLNGAVFAISPTAAGRGYWLAAADGGVFAFGDAQYLSNPIDNSCHAPPGSGCG